MQITRITRKPYTFTVPAAFGDTATIDAVEVAVLQKRHGPNGLTTWLPAAYADGSVTITLAGPDADQTDAIPVPAAGGDLWARVVDDPSSVDGAKIERIVVLDGAVGSEVPASAVDQITAALALKADADDPRFTDSRTPSGGAGGALSGQFPNPGLNTAAVDTSVAANIGDTDSDTSVALRAAFGSLDGDNVWTGAQDFTGATVTGVGGGGGATTRRAMAVLSTPVTGTLANAEITFRLSNMLPSDTTRWRVRIRNYLLRTETVVASGASFVGIYHGEQALDATGAPTAGFVTAPSQAVGAFTLAADGTEYVSSWITSAGNQITGGKPWLWSFAYTGGGTQGSSQGQMWYRVGAGTSAFVADQPATSFTSTGAQPFDIRIEYETVTDKKVVLFVGDSITYGTASAVIPGQHAYPVIYGNRHGHLAMNAGVPGALASEWDDATTLWKYQRFNPAEIVPDQAWVFIGTNDLTNGAGVALATYRGYILTIIGLLRTLGVPRIGLCTIPPRNLAHGVIARPVAVGATSVTTWNGSLSAGTVQLGEGGLGETVTLSATPTSNSDGSYTYTITATARAHAVGEVLAHSQETLRLGYNAFLRSQPGGVRAMVSLDRVWQAPWDKSIAQPEFVQTDNLHPSVPGAARLAEAFPA